MEGPAVFYTHDMPSYPHTYGGPQEMFFVNPAFPANTQTTFATTAQDFSIPTEAHLAQHEQHTVDFHPQAGQMMPGAAFMSPSGSFDGSVSQSSSSTSLVGLSGSTSRLHSHPTSPSGSAYRGIQRFSPYTTTRPKNKRTGVACDPCRAKKQKCDGQKRCHQCVTNNLECKYREIEPKTSGNVLDQIAKMMASCSEAIQDLHEKVDSLESRLAKIEARVAAADRNPSSPFRCHQCSHGKDGENHNPTPTVSARL